MSLLITSQGTLSVKRLSVLDRCAAHLSALRLSRAGQKGADSGRLCWSGPMQWAWEDLNLRPLPYQLTAGNRCAEGRFCRSRATVGAKVKWSIGVQLSVLPMRLEPTDPAPIIAPDPTSRPALHHRLPARVPNHGTYQRSSPA